MKIFFAACFPERIHLEGSVLVHGRDAGITNQHGNLSFNRSYGNVKEFIFQDKENGYYLTVSTCLFGCGMTHPENGSFRNN